MLFVVDSHTEGEPTRVVVKGSPKISGSVTDKVDCLRAEHDWIRRRLCLEPSGSEIAVGALVFPPSDPQADLDVVFVNNEGYLGMCGHGTIGLVVSLDHVSGSRFAHDEWIDREWTGSVTLNTCVGLVQAERVGPNTVKFDNVPSFVSELDLCLDVPGFGSVSGDVAFGGNWFFLVRDSNVDMEQSDLTLLLAFSSGVLSAAQKVDPRIDHVEIFGKSRLEGADSRNFVLCPGRQYDRSPCGTGTSAKLAALYAAGQLQEGQIWRQEGFVGGLFEGQIRVESGKITPTVTGTAYVTAETVILERPQDPMEAGWQL